MPFTLAHPAIVVPIWQRAPRSLVLSALVVGSMAPDFEYFVFLHPMRTVGHDPIGIPLLCVPSGLAVLWAFHCVVKRPLVLVLPGPLRRRLLGACRPFPFRPAGRFLAIVASLALGAASHIAWDAFTHEDGWVVRRCPPLAAPVAPGVKVFKVLQHGSTAVGLAVLGAWSGRWFRSRRPEPEPAGSAMSDALRCVILAALVVIPLAAGVAVCAVASNPGISKNVVTFGVVAITAFCVATFAYGIAYRAWSPR